MVVDFRKIAHHPQQHCLLGITSGSWELSSHFTLFGKRPSRDSTYCDIIFYSATILSLMFSHHFVVLLDCKEQSGLQRGPSALTFPPLRTCIGLGSGSSSADPTHPQHNLLDLYLPGRCKSRVAVKISHRRHSFCSQAFSLINT